jgi:hypothetical protein
MKTFQGGFFALFKYYPWVFCHFFSI